jgi:flagellar motor switch protein FliG
MNTAANRYSAFQDATSQEPSLSEAMQHGIKQSNKGEVIDSAYKVAVILLMVGPDVSAEVLRRLGPEDVKEISARMSSMHLLDKETVVSVLEEFKAITSGHVPLAGDIDTFMQSTITMLDAKQPSKLPGIDAVATANPAELYEIIKNEHPQIIASLLTYLKPEQTSVLLAMFTEERRNDLMLRVALLEQVDPGAIRELNDVMVTAMAKNSRTVGVGGVNPVADILNLMNGEMNQGALERIRQYDAELADSILEKMFVFEDFLDVEDKSMETLLLEVPQDVLVVALKGASPKLREKLFTCMTRRTAERIRDELDTLPPVKVVDVEERQREIISIARRLEGERRISLQGENQFTKTI